jgi:hypothetical protein
MQTVELKFTKLEKMPVPKSKDEYLAKRYKDGSIAFFPAIGITTGCYTFAIELLNNEAEYCHLKVTAATEPKFNVGDRVTSKAYPHIQGKILHLNFETALVYDYSENYVLDLTDLTLITE